MAEYWRSQTLLTEKKPKWEGVGGVETPDLVVISLGGNDYNHHNGNVPSNEDFSEAYGAFITSVFNEYGEGVKVLNVCGQGSPEEATYDPDNNRCSPCQHVEDAVAEFQADNEGMEVDYLFVPCDGSVVEGLGDIGCAGHKNRVGQRKVAEFDKGKVGEMLK